MSMNKESYGLFRLFDREFFEDFNSYRPGAELLSIARALIPLDWSISRNGNWYKALPPVYEMPQQGWKIHISATPGNCADIVAQVTNICIEQQLPFKFLLDSFLVELSTSKSWSREASGKFITIYPKDEAAFIAQIELFYEQLKEFNGAYILTDKRYKDSKVIYYRYGGITGDWSLGVYGEKRYMLTAPDGEQMPDWRAPYWNPPYWVNDPFESSGDEDEEESLTLNNGRYVIQESLHFSVTGGVYLAVDLDTGSNVIIKEARPYTAIDCRDIDATDRLASEFKFLKMFSEKNIVPRPIDYFKDWEHHYLVEEYVEGLDLAKWSITHNPLISQTLYEAHELQQFLNQIKRVWLNVARTIHEFHKLNVRCGDISSKNFIITNFENGTVKMIDLEVVSEADGSYVYPLGTPGFQRNKEQNDGTSASLHDDIYALGVLFASTLFPNSNFRDLEEAAHTRYVDSLMNDFNVEPRIIELLHSIFEQPQRLNITEIIEVLESWIADSSHIASPAAIEHHFLPQEPDGSKHLQAIVNQIAKYIHESATITRADRLFPADPMAFQTNPLNLAHGALGIAYALQQVNKALPDKTMNWILAKNITEAHYPPGLFHGLSGIAWALYDLGHQQYAEQILELAGKHPLLSEAADMLNGLAGYGMSCLHFYKESGNKRWLYQAVSAGEELLRTGKQYEYGVAWEDHERKIWLGYGKGASGIAVFLLYLYLVTNDERYLAIGQQAVGFELHHATMQGEALYLPGGYVGEFHHVKNGYWLDGSAGLGIALIRYWAVTREEKYLTAFQAAAHACNRKYAAFPSFSKGLSGLGQLLLDGYVFTGEPHYMEAAGKVLSGTLLFTLHRSTGIAYPGEQLFRISCDYATGSAGVLLFLDRYQHIGHKHENPNFLLDSLLADYMASERPVEAAAIKV